MARIRTIKPDFFRSEEIGSIEPIARLLFIGLWTMADRDGRLLDRPRRISVEVFPYDDDLDIAMHLVRLAEVGLIDRYEVDGVRCIQICGFSKHQRPHPKEPPSEIPTRPLESLEKTATLSGDVGQSRVLQRPAVESNGETLPCRSLREGKGREGKEISFAFGEIANAKPTVPSVLVFPCNGDPSEWHLTVGQVALWTDLFPGVAVEIECRKAKAWVLANKKKTAAGMARFLTRWLGNANDRQPSARGSPRSFRSDPTHDLEDLTPLPPTRKANTA